jgi:hypothetical protein
MLDYPITHPVLPEIKLARVIRLRRKLNRFGQIDYQKLANLFRKLHTYSYHDSEISEQLTRVGRVRGRAQARKDPLQEAIVAAAVVIARLAWMP